ncbi:MAG: DUF6427 family protein [Bacteroidota bacterium]
MILRLFKNSIGIQLVILLLTLILLWLPAFSVSRPMPLPELITPAYMFLYNLLYNLPVLYTAIAIILLAAGAFLLNTLLSDFGILPKNSYLTAFLYIVLMSCSSNYLTLHPVLFVNILIILLLRMIFVANQKEDSLKEIFAAGILAALCSLFVFKSVGLFVAVWFFLVILRIYSWRQWAVNLFGFASVYLYLFAWYLFADKLLEKVHLYRNVFQSQHVFHGMPSLSVYEYIMLGIILFLLLIAAVNFLFDVSEKIINIRRITMVLFWLLIISAASVIFYLTKPVFDFAFILLPMSVLTSLYYNSLKRSLFAEIILLLLIVSIVLCRL